MTDPALLYNGFTASDPEAQRKNEIEAVTKLLEQNPNNPYWQSRYNELVIKPIYGENWEQDADRLHELLASDVHPVEEAYQAEKQYECEMCDNGIMDLGYGTPYDKQKCPCCNGNWQDCPNCRQNEGTGTDTADLLAGMRG